MPTARLQIDSRPVANTAAGDFKVTVIWASAHILAVSAVIARSHVGLGQRSLVTNKLRARHRLLHCSRASALRRRHAK